MPAENDEAVPEKKAKPPTWMTDANDVFGNTFGHEVLTKPKELAAALADWETLSPGEQSFYQTLVGHLNLRAQATVVRELRGIREEIGLLVDLNLPDDEDVIDERIQSGQDAAGEEPAPDEEPAAEGANAAAAAPPAPNAGTSRIQRAAQRAVAQQRAEQEAARAATPPAPDQTDPNVGRAPAKPRNRPAKGKGAIPAPPPGPPANGAGHGKGASGTGPAKQVIDTTSASDGDLPPEA